MNLNVQLTKLTVPELEFAGSGYFRDPRRGLIDAGPFDLRYGASHRTQLRLAIVGTPEMIDLGLNWFERCKQAIASSSESGSNTHYPGFEAIYRSELITDANFTWRLDQVALDNALAKSPFDAFTDIVAIYANAIRQAKRDFRPDVIVCAIPEAVERKCWSVRRQLDRYEKKVIERIAKQVNSDQFVLPLEWETEEDPEDLLNRDLRRALKAEAMRLEIPIQIARANLFLDLKTNEEAAIRAWNSTVGLYYKAGGIPWRLKSSGPETCYVGITFHHLRTNKRALVYSALAQAFSTNGEGFALKGSALEPESNSRRRPNLTSEQAFVLGGKVLYEYIKRNGVAPKRVVLHKSSRFSSEEMEGFGSAFREVPLVQLVALVPSNVRLVTHAAYPPSRGTLLTIQDSRYFLFTSGYISELATYPGPHVPTPVELVIQGKYDTADVRQAATDVLALGRLNWNTSDLRSSQPVTLGFARRVGGIMAEYGLVTSSDPDPSYRYYM
jgi:hypothetical protein